MVLDCISSEMVFYFGCDTRILERSVVWKQMSSEFFYIETFPSPMEETPCIFYLSQTYNICWYFLYIVLLLSIMWNGCALASCYWVLGWILISLLWCVNAKWYFGNTFKYTQTADNCPGFSQILAWYPVWSMSSFIITVPYVNNSALAWATVFHILISEWV